MRAYLSMCCVCVCVCLLFFLQGRGRFSMSSERQQRAGSEKGASPRQSGGNEPASKVLEEISFLESM